MHWSGSVDSLSWGPHGSPPTKFQAAGMLQLPLAGRCPESSQHVGWGHARRLFPSCQVFIWVFTTVVTQVKNEDKTFIPRTVMSQLRACHQLWVLACFPPFVLACLLACLLAGVLACLFPAYCVLSCLPACFALARLLGCFLLRLRAGLLAALVLRPSFLACLLRLPAGLLAALRACCPSYLPACSTRLAVFLIAARSLGLDGASVRAMGWRCGMSSKSSILLWQWGLGFELTLS